MKAGDTKDLFNKHSQFNKPFISWLTIIVVVDNTMNLSDVDMLCFTVVK